MAALDYRLKGSGFEPQRLPSGYRRPSVDVQHAYLIIYDTHPRLQVQTTKHGKQY